jgi:carboxypeptidase C (cathepsin A)
MKYQHSKHCVDGKRRNYWIYFIDGVEILRQKVPFDENGEKGFDHFVGPKDVYLYDENIHQTRQIEWKGTDNYKEREVKFPVSKQKLKELHIKKDDKILLTN